MTAFESAIREKIAEEQHDGDAYHELARRAADEGHFDYAAILRDIAREENTHRIHLQGILAELETYEAHTG